MRPASPIALVLLASVGASVAACAPATPEEPTWLSDVRPILVANCVRCHGYPPIGGAPGSFRLDRYDDEFIDGLLVRGAATMAPFIAARASERGDMPPRGAFLAQRQKDILARWVPESPQRAALGSRPGNRRPTATLLPQRVITETRAQLTVEVSDPDGDLVFGSLLLGDPLRPGYPLRPGRQTVIIDLGPYPGGRLPLLANLSDDEVAIPVALGAIDIPAKPSAPPSLTVLAPTRDAVLRGTVDVVFTVEDPDGNVPAVTFVARRPGESREIALDGQIRRGMNTLRWDTTQLPEGTNWSLRVTAVDGSITVTVDTPEFIITRATTSDGFADIFPILEDHCQPCHPGVIDPDTKMPDFGKLDEIRPFAGLAWRKVVQLREMPPPSTDLVLDPAPPPLSDADRERLGAWLLAGAPP